MNQISTLETTQQIEKLIFTNLVQIIQLPPKLRITTYVFYPLLLCITSFRLIQTSAKNVSSLAKNGKIMT